MRSSSGTNSDGLFSKLVDAANSPQDFDYPYWIATIVSAAFKKIFKLLGSLLVIIAFVLIISISLSSYIYLIPTIAQPYTLWYGFNWILGIIMITNILFNYYMAVTTSPGFPTLHDLDDTQNYKICKKCDFPKPTRCHHCSVCKKCILRFDHHCPWINNCVGERNYKYFILFLFWLTLATGYITLLATPYVLEQQKEEFHEIYIEFITHWQTKYTRITNNMIKTKDFILSYFIPNHNIIGPITRHLRDIHVNHIHLSTSHMSQSMIVNPLYIILHSHEIKEMIFSVPTTKAVLLMLAVICGTLFTAAGGLFLFHFYLMSTAQTTVEYFESLPVRSRYKELNMVYISPYSTGNTLLNIKQIMGDNLIKTILLPSTVMPVSNSLYKKKDTNTIDSHEMV